MTEYVKLKDVKKLLKLNEKDNTKANTFDIYAELLKEVTQLPTTEIKQDRLEVAKEYCEKRDTCKKCKLTYRGHMDNCLFFITTPRNWEIKKINKAIAKIKEQEK